MKIGIIGSGNVGGTLGKAWSHHGHQVVFAFRNPAGAEAAELLKAAAPTARAASVVDTVRDSDVLVLATPWEATEQILAGAGNLEGKVILDATNPLLPGLAGLAAGTTTSGAEKVAEWAKGARVVKVFNTVGYNIMADSSFPQGKAVMFYCGDDAEAKKAAATLAGELGFDALDAGPLPQARTLEPFAMLWISLAVKYGFGRDIAFQLMRR